MNVQICNQKKPIMVKSIYALLSAKKLPKNPLPNLAKRKKKEDMAQLQYCITKND